MDEKPDLIEVPFADLDPTTLLGVIEAFILREGTNYGANEVSLDTQVKQIQGQLRNRSIKLVFDPVSESCTLLTEKQYRERNGLRDC